MHLSIKALILTLFMLEAACAAASSAAKVSDSTQECIDCHSTTHPGIVEGWRQSRHAAVTPAEAMQVKGPACKVSATKIAQNLRSVAVGCAECHTRRPQAHADTFEHNGYDVHVVVSPDDCRTCHPEERRQYAGNIMAHAYANLAENTVFTQLEQAITGPAAGKPGSLSHGTPEPATRAATCYYCHGTRLKVTGTRTRDSDMGEMEFPIISGWPNQGAGRINPDGSKGSCSACHTRHTFSIETARKPHTCKECHIGPDVPVFKVYSVSKHGNIYDSLKHHWDFKSVPWVIGANFTAPTCAACHISLLTNADGDTVVRRTHRMSDRLSWRIFGLIYAHPQPADPDTTKIRNKDDQQLPATLGGVFVKNALINRETQQARRQTMQTICRNCHAESWVQGHFNRYDQAIQRTNDAIRTATDLMQHIWEAGLASGFSQNANPFDENVERIWSDCWLFHANTIRFSAAMAGGGDYSAFSNGHYHLSRRIAQLEQWMRDHPGKCEKIHMKDARHEHPD